ncbi:MAG: hypothetical protein GKR91_09315 [Pseudomonadales bacterium]|nr:hypothetical protein [Pseudomonadales bacterium]
MKSRVLNISVINTLLLLVFSISVKAQEDVCQTIQVANNSITTPVNIGGGEYRAAISTNNIGAMMTETFAEELGLSVHEIASRQLSLGFGEDLPYKYVEDINLDIFGRTITRERMVVLENSAAPLAISLRLFDGYIIQIDFSESKICFFPRDAMDLRELANTEFDSDPISGNPVIRVNINEDVTTWLVLSLGYWGGALVDSSSASLLGYYAREDIREGSHEDLAIFENANLTLGPYRLVNLPVEFPKQGVEDNIATVEQLRTGSHIFRDRGSNGSIGVEALKNFTLTFDLERELMHIVAE